MSRRSGATASLSGDARKILLTVLVVFVISFFAYQSYRSIVLTQQKLNTLDSAQEQVDDLRLKNLSLLLEAEYVLSDEFVEAQARNKLDLAREGEVLILIPEGLLAEPELEAYIESQKGYEVGDVQEIEDSQQSLFEIWWAYLFGSS